MLSDRCRGIYPCVSVTEISTHPVMQNLGILRLDRNLAEKMTEWKHDRMGKVYKKAVRFWLHSFRMREATAIGAAVSARQGSPYARCNPLGKGLGAGWTADLALSPQASLPPVCMCENKQDGICEETQSSVPVLMQMGNRATFHYG